ncbi:MAG TPA: GNAT family N-acetyltransferase [Nitrolancea sp.]|nr:GNAT family N-acetyltransferase [Nitrolancea sp.]
MNRTPDDDTQGQNVPGSDTGAARIVNIVGERVALGPFRRDLVPAYQRWINDFTTMRTYGTPRPLTVEQATAWYEKQTTKEERARFTVYELATWRPIGKTALYDIDFHHRTAEFGIIIGEPDCRGKGYGTEAALLTLDYAFTALELHNVMLEVAEFNQAGRRVYAKAGFREFGRRRQSWMMGGRLWDVIYMDCLATEFSSPVLGSVFVPDQANPSTPEVAHDDER